MDNDVIVIRVQHVQCMGKGPISVIQQRQYKNKGIIPLLGRGNLGPRYNRSVSHKNTTWTGGVISLSGPLV